MAETSTIKAIPPTVLRTSPAPKKEETPRLLIDGKQPYISPVGSTYYNPTTGKSRVVFGGGGGGYEVPASATAQTDLNASEQERLKNINAQINTEKANKGGAKESLLIERDRLLNKQLGLMSGTYYESGYSGVRQKFVYEYNQAINRADEKLQSRMIDTSLESPRGNQLLYSGKFYNPQQEAKINLLTKGGFIAPVVTEGIYSVGSPAIEKGKAFAEYLPRPYAQTTKLPPTTTFEKFINRQISLGQIYENIGKENFKERPFKTSAGQTYYPSQTYTGQFSKEIGRFLFGLEGVGRGIISIPFYAGQYGEIQAQRLFKIPEKDQIIKQDFLNKIATQEELAYGGIALGGGLIASEYGALGKSIISTGSLLYGGYVSGQAGYKAFIEKEITPQTASQLAVGGLFIYGARKLPEEVELSRFERLAKSSESYKIPTESIGIVKTGKGKYQIEFKALKSLRSSILNRTLIEQKSKVTLDVVRLDNKSFQIEAGKVATQISRPSIISYNKYELAYKLFDNKILQEEGFTFSGKGRTVKNMFGFTNDELYSIINFKSRPIGVDLLFNLETEKRVRLSPVQTITALRGDIKAVSIKEPFKSIDLEIGAFSQRINKEYFRTAGGKIEKERIYFPKYLKELFKKIGIKEDTFTTRVGFPEIIEAEEGLLKNRGWLGYYSRTRSRIAYEPSLSEGEIKTVIKHEYGHFLDNLKKISENLTPKQREVLQPIAENYLKSQYGGKIPEVYTPKDYIPEYFADLYTGKVPIEKLKYSIKTRSYGLFKPESLGLFKIAEAKELTFDISKKLPKEIPSESLTKSYGQLLRELRKNAPEIVSEEKRGKAFRWIFEDKKARVSLGSNYIRTKQVMEIPRPEIEYSETISAQEIGGAFGTTILKEYTKQVSYPNFAEGKLRRGGEIIIRPYESELSKRRSFQFELIKQKQENKTRLKRNLSLVNYSIEEERLLERVTPKFKTPSRTKQEELLQYREEPPPEVPRKIITPPPLKFELTPPLFGIPEYRKTKSPSKKKKRRKEPIAFTEGFIAKTLGFKPIKIKEKDIAKELKRYSSPFAIRPAFRIIK